MTERIRKHAVVAPFTVENGLLTPTQKIRRMLVIRANANVLAKLHGYAHQRACAALHAQRAAVQVEQRLLLLDIGGFLLADANDWRSTFASKPADFASA